MKNRLPIYLFALVLGFITSNCTAQEADSSKQNLKLAASDLNSSLFPKPIGYVNDFENIFTAEQEKQLTDFITLFEKNTTNQVAIVTVSSIDPYTDFDQYAINLSNAWGVGDKKKNNGLTIVFSNSLRRIKISTGTGIESVLTDEICQSVLDQTIVPHFKNGKYFEGISVGLAELTKHWK